MFLRCKSCYLFRKNTADAPYFRADFGKNGVKIDFFKSSETHFFCLIYSNLHKKK